MTEPLLSIRHVTKRFGVLKAVDDVSLRLDRGEILGLIGANGAGKTTLIRMVCALTTADEGEILAAARPGYMSQSFSLIEELTVQENIRFYSAFCGEGDRRGKEEDLLHRLRLDPYRDTRACHLASGWRQTLSFAIALLRESPLLILDEPTSGLDAVSRRRIWSLVRDAAEGGAGVLITTHYLDEARLCHRLAVMGEGRILAQGKPEEVAAGTEELMEYFKR